MPQSLTHGSGILLSRHLPGGHWHGNEVRISSCCTQAEACQPGDLFVAFDDEAFVEQHSLETATSRGATAILSERILPCSLPQYVVDNCRSAYSQLCQTLVGDPAKSLRTVGITGTYGKTVTQMLLMQILRQSGNRVGVLGSLADSDSSHTGAGRKSYNSAELASWLARSRANGCTHAIVEANSQTLARRDYHGMEFDAAIITNIAREHVNLHGSLRRYQDAKARILQHLKPGGVAVLNADDQASCRILSELDCPVITFGMRHPAEVTATLLERHVSEQTFLLETGDESLAVRTRMIGDAHIYNCLAAATTALVMGISPADVTRGLEQITELPGRMQRVECGQPFGTFVDLSHSPESLANALTTLREVTRGELHCLVGVDSRLSEPSRAQIGRVLERLSDNSILTGSRLDRAMSMKSAHDILDGFDRPAQAHLMPSRAKAICWTLSKAKPGDVVLLAGGIESPGPDDVTLTDEDVVRYWLQFADQEADCPWIPA